MTEINEQVADFHVRLGRLEQVVLDNKPKKIDSKQEDIIEFILAIVSLVTCYYGFGLPNHSYQYLFSLLIILCLYHKVIFPRPVHWSEYVLIIINLLIASMLLKLVIGGGEPKPFSWLSYPTLEGGVTSFKLTWQQTSAAQWELPLTVIQSFFLIVTLFGVLVRFELLSGLASFVLAILAVPALVDFNWTWAMPAMIASLACFYLQSE